MARGAVLVLAGPTGAGKTGAALFMAERLGGEIVNFDSRQVYADIPVITAQPTPAEQALFPHHLYGYLPLSARPSAGAFAALARRTASEILARGRSPILVGGTGLYLRAILSGLAHIPDIPEAARRAVLDRMERLGPAAMHAELARVDPVVAGRVHPSDRQRVSRALEVFQATGVPLGAWQARGRAETGEAPFQAVKIGLAQPMEELTPLLAARIGLMLEAGALGEARAVLAAHPQGLDGALGIGVGELCAHLRGELSLDAAKALWLANTRAYAKRQMTWFRKEPDLAWFSPRDPEAVLAHALAAGLGRGGRS